MWGWRGAGGVESVANVYVPMAITCARHGYGDIFLDGIAGILLASGVVAG